MGGRPGVLRRPRVLRALGEIGREALVEALDGDVERGAQRLDEAFGLGGLVAALAAHRQRQADDDPLRALCADDLHESGEAVTSRRALDDADRPRDRPGFVRDRNSGACRAEVERDHLHARADVMCVLPTSNASARPSGFFPPASARLARPPPPPPIFFAASPEVTASIRRAPEPTEPSERTTKGPISAVQRTCVPPHSSREKPGISTTRTSSPYFSPKSIIAPSLRASSICVTNARTGRFSKIRSLTIRSTSARSSGVSAWGCVKSKRSLSGRTAEPAWRTCSPSTSRSARCRRCVAVWLVIVGKRTSHGTTARTRSPAAKPLPWKTSTWSSPILYASASAARAPVSSCSMKPWSLTWPPPSG